MVGKWLKKVIDVRDGYPWGLYFLLTDNSKTKKWNTRHTMFRDIVGGPPGGDGLVERDKSISGLQANLGGKFCLGWRGRGGRGGGGGGGGRQTGNRLTKEGVEKEKGQLGIGRSGGGTRSKWGQNWAKGERQEK